MLILVLRTDKPDAEIGLYNDEEQLDYVTWQAHRELSVTLHKKIKELLDAHQKAWSDIEGVVAYQGPGRFTGLRIGLSVANALAASYRLPVVGATGEKWCNTGVQLLLTDRTQSTVMPEYGNPVHITQQRK